MWNKKSQFVGFNNDPNPTEGDIITIEIDLSSEEKEKRRLTIFHKDI